MKIRTRILRYLKSPKSNVKQHIDAPNPKTTEKWYSQAFVFEYVESLDGFSVTHANDCVRDWKKIVGNELRIPSKYANKPVVEIKSNAFAWNSSIKRIILPASVKIIGKGAFRCCSSLEEIIVDNENVNFYSSGNCLVKRGAFLDNNLNYTTIENSIILGCKNSIIPMDGTIISIGASAFERCDGLSEIKIPSSVKDIETRAFAECGNLSSIITKECSFDQNELHIISVSNIEAEAFFNCGLEFIYFSEKVAYIGKRAFGGCSFLKRIMVESDNKNYCSTRNCLIQLPEKTMILGCRSSIIPTADQIYSISEDAFFGYGDFPNIRFCDAKCEWDKIDKHPLWLSNTNCSAVECTDGPINISRSLCNPSFRCSPQYTGHTHGPVMYQHTSPSFKDILKNSFKKEKDSKKNSTPINSISDVQISAVTLEKCELGKYLPINIIMYADDYRYVVDDYKEELGTKSKEKNGAESSVAVNSKVKVVLTSNDVTVRDGIEERIWNGKYINFEFAVLIPRKYNQDQLLFTVSVYIGDIIATRLKIIVNCATNVERKMSITREDVFSAFVSYASQDRNRVAAIIQGMKKARPDLDIFFDIESLRSGQKWEEALWSEIDRRDMLYLCWSHNASESKWVDREWRYALDTKGEECIEPIPLESPDTCPPPAELQMKHFNDKMVYIIQATTKS